MAAVRSGKVDAVQLLLRRGANVSLTDAEGLTAAAWAERMQRHSVIEVLTPTAARHQAHARQVIPSHGPAVRAAAERGLALLEKSGSDWLSQQRCASCHHQGMLLPVARVAKQQGFRLDETGAHAQEIRLRTFLGSFEPAMQAAHGGDEATVRFALGFFGQMTSGSAWFLGALMSPGVDQQPLETAAVAAAGATQLADGRWRVGIPRVPIQESDFQTTALMIRALTSVKPQAADTPDRVARARRWLISAPATTTIDSVYRLLGLHWSDAEGNWIRDAAQVVLDAQDETGGWAPLTGLNPDAYATGLALVALREADALTHHMPTIGAVSGFWCAPSSLTARGSCTNAPPPSMSTSKAVSRTASISSVPSLARRGQPWP